MERKYQEKLWSFLFQNHVQGALLRENQKLALLFAIVRKWQPPILWCIQRVTGGTDQTSGGCSLC